MNDADLMPIRLPEKYNYEVWEDPNVNKPVQGNSTLTVSQSAIDTLFPEDPKENLHPTTNTLFSGLHAFSPFKAHREARALKALDVATLPEYRDLKGHFFNEFGKSFFSKRSSLVPNRFRASKVNLFKPRTGIKKKPSLSVVENNEFEDADMLMGAESDSGPVEDTKDLVQFPSPKWAVPAHPAQKVQPIPIPGSVAVEPSFNSAFRPIQVTRPTFGAPNPSAYNHKMPDTPFNTPMVAFMSRSLPNNFGSQEAAESRSSEEKMNLRPRPTRPPTLFGFASDLSEDEHGQAKPRSKRKINKA
jgi:hypothetical protein